ncbi:MAG: BspA family leucine-rich repeat surface protein [Bacteroidales bacterium]|nr:BspA family leucine-rich repeat surface protein [Bacteroidales bacterium]
MKKIAIAFLTFLILPSLVLAQSSGLWNDPGPKLKSTDARWNGISTNRKRLNNEVLNNVLSTIQKDEMSTFSIPHPKGGELLFNVCTSNLMAKELRDKYPNIKTLKGVNNKGDRIRIDINHKGLHAIVYSDKGTIYLDPESIGSGIYVSYFSDDYKRHNPGDDMHQELTEYAVSDETTLKSTNQISVANKSVGTHLRKFRIAIAASSNYTQFHGGTKQDGLAAIVTTLNRVTGIYERDFGITFELVPDNDKIIFTSSNSDPYKNLNMQSRRTKNQEVTDDKIGFDNYDIGHLVTAYSSGGQAFFGAVCNTMKAATSTGRANPVGDPFDVEYVAHEIGHQFGAYHTFSGKAGYCSYNGQYNWSAAYEPGSGTTIMAYAGLCGEDNVGSTNYYFHAGSINNILNYVIDGYGKNCVTLIETGNTPPTINLRDGGFVIPVNTPFVLEAEANDVDNDQLTYCWEQYDRGPQANLDSPSETGPLFRSFSPTENNKRYFPKLSKVINGQTNTANEKLPWNTRELNFMITVRDNNVNGGGITNQKLTFSSSDQAGPFKVTSTYPNAQYEGFSNITVEWDVANTNVTPVNCQNVNILYSIDGGENFNIVLEENTGNDGSATVKLPNIATSKARIMVKAADNIFFNVNSANFNVVATAANAPGAPSNLTGSKTGLAKVQLSWTDNTDQENGFYIERKDGDNSFVVIDSVLLNMTTYVDESIIASGDYSYRIAAYNATGISSYTNTIAISYDEVIPHTPTELSGNLSNINIVELSWTDNSSNESGFIIQRQKGTAGFKEIGRTIPNESSYIDNSIQSSGDYTYRVKAYNALGSSDFSNVETINGVNVNVAPNAPSDLTGTKISDVTVELTWVQNSTIEEGFIIERREVGNDVFEEIHRTSMRINSYKDELGKAAEYSYRIAAFNSHGTSNYSNVTTVQGSTPFITKWQITAGETLEIPLIRPLEYDFDYKWLKDGVVVDSGHFAKQSVKDEKITTGFTEGGIYQLEILGVFPGADFPKSKLTEITQWGGIIWTRIGFKNWEGTISATDAPDLRNIESLKEMFSNAPNVNANFNNWDVSHITSMESMFSGATSFNGDISNWDVGNVTNMKQMFNNAKAFNSNISDWNVGKVTEMNNMFSGTEAFNVDISKWNVSQVTNMTYMFQNTMIFNQDISQWNTASLKNLQGTFQGAVSFNQDLGGWNVSGVTNMKYMFNNANLSTRNFDRTLIGWAEQNVQQDVDLKKVSCYYCVSGQARQTLFNDYGWAMKDEGRNCPESTSIIFFTLPEQTSNAIINDTTYSIKIHVYSSTDVSALTPTITLLDGATCSPSSEETLDFTNAVTYTVTGDDGTTTQDWTVEVIVSNVSSIDQQVISHNNDLDDLYPNPTTGFLFLPNTWSEKAEQIVIFDMQGKKLVDFSINSPIDMIDVSGLSKGLYFMQVTLPGKDIVKKFIKK